MRILAIAGAVLMLFVAGASAGDLQVASSTLENMGLGGMQPLSDADGQAVRGQGLGDQFLVPVLGGLDGAIASAMGEAGVGGNISISSMVLGSFSGFPDGGLGGGFGGVFGGGLGGGFGGGGFGGMFPL